MAPPTIVVVEDDRFMALLLKRLLERERYRVELITESEQALGVVNAIRPQLVILNILMPRVNGFSLCKQIRTHPELKRTRILFHSSKAHPIDQWKAYQLGADGYLIKPSRSEQFLSEVKRLLASPS